MMLLATSDCMHGGRVRCVCRPSVSTRIVFLVCSVLVGPPSHHLLSFLLLRCACRRVVLVGPRRQLEARTAALLKEREAGAEQLASLQSEMDAMRTKTAAMQQHLQQLANQAAKENAAKDLWARHSRCRLCVTLRFPKLPGTQACRVCLLLFHPPVCRMWCCCCV